MEDRLIDITYDLIRVYVAQSASAVEISKIISKHSKDEVLTGDEIICGLVYRLMKPMTDEEIQKSLTTADALLNDESDEELDEEIEIESESELENDTIRKIRTNQCNCEICIDTRVCLLNFHDYVPKDEFAQKFYDGIVTTCKKHNIYI